MRVPRCALETSASPRRQATAYPFLPVMQTGQGASLNGRPPVKCAACGREFVRKESLPHPVLLREMQAQSPGRAGTRRLRRPQAPDERGGHRRRSPSCEPRFSRTRPTCEPLRCRSWRPGSTACAPPTQRCSTAAADGRFAFRQSLLDVAAVAGQAAACFPARPRSCSPTSGAGSAREGEEAHGHQRRLPGQPGPERLAARALRAGARQRRRSVIRYVCPNSPGDAASTATARIGIGRPPDGEALPRARLQRPHPARPVAPWPVVLPRHSATPARQSSAHQRARAAAMARSGGRCGHAGNRTRPARRYISIIGVP